MSATERRTRVLDEVDASAWVQSGMTIGVGSPPPMALLRHVIRRGVRDLTVVDSGLSLDLLVRSLHPGVTAAEVRARTGFDLGIPARPPVTEPPSAEELHVLRTRIDLEGVLRR